MQKENRTYRFPRDIIKHAETNPEINSFAEWAAQRYREEFMSIESLTHKLEQKSQEAEWLQSEIKRLKEQNKDNPLLTPEQEKWIKYEGIRRLRNGGQINGIHKAFVNDTGATINRRQFRLLLDQYKEG